MEHQTLTANDIKWLRSGTSRTWMLGLFSVAFLFGMSLLHLYLANLWAGLAGLTFAQAWQGWLNGINPHQVYVGVYLKAMEQFDKSGVMLVLAVFSLALCLLNRYERQRKARLLAVFVEQEQAAA